LENNGDLTMAGIIKTKKFLQSTLTAEFGGTTSIPTKAQVGDGTTAASEDDTTLENQNPVSDFNFQTNYPNIDLNNLFAETRFRLGTTEANGVLITEAGNLDASDNLKDRALFSSISKTSDDIAIISIKTKARNVQP